MRIIALSILALGLLFSAGAARALDPNEELGRSIFFDKQLSLRTNQSCADCHDPKVGGTGSVAGINRKGAVYAGSIRQAFGARKPPATAYATPAPVLQYKIEDGEALFVGGNFWDGRATGEKLGNPAADQAQGPFLNPVEQALPDPACVVYRVCNPANPGHYPVSFEVVWGAGACDIDWPQNVNATCAAGDMVDLAAPERAKVDDAYDQIGLSVAAFEASAEVNQYSSKYDAYVAGQATLTAQESLGLSLFAGKGQCSACHVLDTQSDGQPALLTDYTYDNVGTPKNPDNPVYRDQPDFVDTGLGGFLETRLEYAGFAAANLGKHKVPTLRNVALRPGKGNKKGGMRGAMMGGKKGAMKSGRKGGNKGLPKAYTHNGYFKTLAGIVNFYNTRDVKPACPDPLTREKDALAQGCWPAPELSDNLNEDELGNLGLTSAEEAAIVAFLGTLSDGYY
jgi:cytochrome c peroxidase